MRVGIVGGTGFVGSYVVDELVAAGHEPRLLVRQGSESKVVRTGSVRVVSGDLDDVESIRRTVEGCDAVVYLVGILREDARRGVTFDALQRRGAERVVDLARASGVDRFALLSANGVARAGTAYQTTKWQAERYVEASGMRSIILRPSVVFGDPRGRIEFCTQLRDELFRLPVPAPLFFDGVSFWRAGRFRMSPVHVRDVARVLVAALDGAGAGSEVHVLGGPEALEWREIIARIGAALGKRKLALPAPAMVVRGAARMLDSEPWFPITCDQLDMLLAGNVGESSAVFARFGVEPTAFSPANLAYLRG